MDGVDAFLIWNPRHPDEIPMVTTVYNDYTKYFASNTSLDGTLRAFMMVEGRDFIWGSQLGWMGFELLDPANRDKAEYLRRLGQYREATRKFLTFGELVGPVNPKLGVATITEQWRGWSGEAFPAELPAVMASLWRAQDGSIGLFVVNLDTAPQEFSYRIHLQIVDRPGWDETGVVMRRIAPEGTIPVYEAADGTIEDELTLDPGEILVLEGRPPKPGEDLLSETVRAIHDAAQKAAPMPHLPETEDARCDAAWRYLQRQRGHVEPGLWRAAAAFVAEKKSDAVGFGHSFVWGPPPIVPGEAAVVERELWNRGKRAIEYGFSRSGSEALGVASSGIGKWHRLAPGQRETITSSVTPSVPEGRAPVTGWYVDVLHFRTNDLVYDVPRRAILEVLPRTEATVELPPDGVRAGEPFAFQVHVKRNADWPMAECELHIDAPAEWEIIPGRHIPIDPQGVPRKGTIWVLCRVPEDAEIGDVRIGAAVVAAGAETSVRVQPPRPRVAAPRAQNAPNVDADLSEWKGAAVVLDGGPRVKIDGWRGPSDESARAWVQWDQHNLYFAAEVTDDAFSQPHTNRDIWQGDCIQMAFRPGVPPRQASYEGVTELGLALTPEGPLLWEWFPEDRPLEAGAAAVERRGQATYYEASIPWQQLGAAGADLPRLWAWSFTVNDRDGDQFRGWLEWTPGICGGKDASQFGILDLVG
jgi:hypothetical protein